MLLKVIAKDIDDREAIQLARKRGSSCHVITLTTSSPH
jgi:hypothetical protein